MDYLYIGIGAFILIILFIVFLARGEKFQKLSRLSTLAFMMVICAIVFSDAGRIVSYSFFGLGIVISILDIVNRSKKKHSVHHNNNVDID